MADDALLDPVFTDASGHFVTDGAPAGTAVLYANRSRDTALLHGSFRPGTEVTLKLVAPGSIRGTLAVRGVTGWESAMVWTAPTRVPARLRGAWGRTAKDTDIGQVMLPPIAEP